MTQNNIAGPGQTLPYPTNLYPTDLFSAPVDSPTNIVTMSPGDTIALPAGSWMVDPGSYALVQWVDPVTGVWRTVSADRNQSQWVKSDGFNFRVANLLGTPVAAIVAGGGTGFAQSTATITANIGGSTWQAIVGGALTVSSIVATGANFTIPPIVLIPAPPFPGVQATGYATLTSGTVSGVTLNDVGGGYTAATVSAVIVPSPADLATGIVPGQVNFTLTDAGKITGALVQSNGAALSTISALTLTAAGGAGTGATITPQVLQTVILASVVAGGAGWGNVAAPALVLSAGGGGNTSVSAIGNAAIELTGFRPRMFQGIGVTNAGGTISSVTSEDTGMFLSAPSAVLVPGGTLPTTLSSIAFTMGALNAGVKIQQT